MKNLRAAWVAATATRLGAASSPPNRDLVECELEGVWRRETVARAPPNRLPEPTQLGSGPRPVTTGAARAAYSMELCRRPRCYVHMVGSGVPMLTLACLQCPLGRCDGVSRRPMHYTGTPVPSLEYWSYSPLLRARVRGRRSHRVTRAGPRWQTT